MTPEGLISLLMRSVYAWNLTLRLNSNLMFTITYISIFAMVSLFLKSSSTCDKYIRNASRYLYNLIFTSRWRQHQTYLTSGGIPTLSGQRLDYHTKNNKSNNCFKCVFVLFMWQKVNSLALSERWLDHSNKHFKISIRHYSSNWSMDKFLCIEIKGTLK